MDPIHLTIHVSHADGSYTARAARCLNASTAKLDEATGHSSHTAHKAIDQLLSKATPARRVLHFNQVTRNPEALLDTYHLIAVLDT